jgi:integrase
LRTFKEWRAARNHAVSSNNDSYHDEPLVNASLEEMSDKQLDFFLARFVAEVRKTDGAEYPGRTIYEMISSIQAYLRVECKRNVNLIDKTARVFLNSALNFVMKERAGQGIGVETAQAKFITEEQENYLWEHCFLGSTNAALLRDTLVFVFGIQFALRAGQEHRNLRRENSQISLQVDEFGDEYLQYNEDISKTNNGGLAHLRIKRKVVRAYKNLKNPERCPVDFYNKYLSHVPTTTSDNAFYLRVLPKPNGQIWYNYKKAAGRETLGNVVKNVMKNAGFEGYFTNHSLRRSCATRLCDARFREQVIQETTGHRSSDGIKAYKCTSSSLKGKASGLLQGVQCTFPEAERGVKCKNGARDLYENFNESSKMCESVTCEVGTRVECKTKTDVKPNFDKVVSSCDQSIFINTDCTKIVVSYK